MSERGSISCDSSPSSVQNVSRLRADSVPNFDIFDESAPQGAAAARPPNQFDMLSGDSFKSERWLRLAGKLQERQELLSIATTHGIRVTEENEKLNLELSKLRDEHSELLFRFQEEEKKCEYRHDLINDLQKDKLELTVALEQLEIKCKSQEEAKEDDVITLTHQKQSLEDLRTARELLHHENWTLKKELNLLIEKGKRDAEVIASLKSKLHQTERAQKHALARLSHLEERQEDYSEVAQKLRQVREKLESALLEKDEFASEVEKLRTTIEIQAVEGLNFFKQTHKFDNEVVQIARLNSTPSPPLVALSADVENSEASAILTLMQHDSGNCSTGSYHQIPSKAERDPSRHINSAKFNPQQTTADPDHITTNALSEYLYMTASALKIKFRNVHVSQDILAKVGQSVPFWEAYDVMQKYITEAETKQVLDQVNRYQETIKRKAAGVEQEGDSEDDDYKIQNNVPIYHWSMITDPRSFFTRLSTQVTEKLVPTAVFSNIPSITSMTQLTPWGQTKP